VTIPIQFAVVREDPSIEMHLIESISSQRALVVASGGCTALSLARRFPGLSLTAIDINAAQLDLLRRKMDAVQLNDPVPRQRLFNIGSDSPDGLNACGNFESLFRGFREFISDMILPAPQLLSLFKEEHSECLIEALTRHRYWPVAFDLFFSEGLLMTMFGPEATQYAEKDSYPKYFQAAIEKGLIRPDKAGHLDDGVSGGCDGSVKPFFEKRSRGGFPRVNERGFPLHRDSSEADAEKWGCNSQGFHPQSSADIHSGFYSKGSRVKSPRNTPSSAADSGILTTARYL
jgi:hypothetical protein